MFSIAIFQASSLLYQLLYAGRCVTVPLAQMHSRYGIIAWQFQNYLGFFLPSVPILQVSVLSIWPVASDLLIINLVFSIKTIKQ